MKFPKKACCALLIVVSVAASAVGQEPLPPAGVFGPAAPPRVSDYSFMYIEATKPRELKLHDIITINVKETSRVKKDSRFNRQRNGTFKAELKEFMRIGETGNLENAAPNEPAMDGQLQSRIQTTGALEEKEETSFTIAATVVDVLPNGYLVLEARKSIRTDRDVWQIRLTGILRPDDIQRNNTAMSENIADLVIAKTQNGKVYHSTKRSWGTRLMDVLFPF